MRTVSIETDGFCFAWHRHKTSLCFPLPSDSEEAVKAILSEMQASYVLSYNSTNPTLDGKQRQIKVEVIDPSLAAKATVFVRDSYTAPKN